MHVHSTLYTTWSFGIFNHAGEVADLGSRGRDSCSYSSVRMVETCTIVATEGDAQYTVGCVPACMIHTCGAPRNISSFRARGVTSLRQHVPICFEFRPRCGRAGGWGRAMVRKYPSVCTLLKLLFFSYSFLCVLPLPSVDS